ncbi:ECF-type sigma factor [Paenibacillus sp. y28]|uniref:ECF-type sigma factor n=1 Tax=Paenibacillus sp. y28 TaxID=3129110 RepID=UPI003019D26F
MAGSRNEKEQYAIELLKRYKWLAGRIKLLEKQPNGGGLPIVLDSGEDKQQDLHNQPQSLPASSYLSLRELQELQWRKELLDRALELLSEIRPELVKLLRLRYIEGRLVDDVATELCISRKTFDRWRVRAIAEFAHLISS